MKLRTSFFNATVLRKDITRFSPVWGLYTIFQVLFVLASWQSEGTGPRFAANAPYILVSMGALNLCYAGLCALLLFGDLFKSRMCNMLHAMPLRREGWFFTHLCAAILFCLVPNALSCLLAAAFLGPDCYVAFLWLGVSLTQYVFFLGVGVFSVMCAGNRLGATAVYAMVNFLAPLVAWLIKTFYEPALYGIEIDLSYLSQGSPAVYFANSRYVSIAYDNMKSIARFEGYLPGQWEYLLVAGAVGLALMALSLLLYRRRQLECAGDLISTRFLSPVILVLYALCVGSVMYMIGEAVNTVLGWLFLFVGLTIGFFTGRMLLEKKVNVFRGKNFLGWGVFLSLFLASLVLTFLDPTGITRRVPRPEQVKTVYVSPYANRYDLTDPRYALSDPADIQAITQLHAQQIAAKLTPGDYDVSMYLRYELTDGTVMERLYGVDADSPQAQVLRKYYSAPKAVLGVEDPQILLQQAQSLEFHPFHTDYPFVGLTSPRSAPEDSLAEKYGYANPIIEHLAPEGFETDELTLGLMDAIMADCRAGSLAQLPVLHRSQDALGELVIRLPSEVRTYRSASILVFEDCENTLAYLKGLTPQ